VIRPVLFDAGPLGRIAHPKPNAQFLAWFDGILDAGAVVILPEIADYEVRRSLLLAGLTASVQRLDELKQTLLYQPITTGVMMQAAEFWAQARKRGQTTADPKELNGDVILAAQALEADGIVVTDNLGHLTQFVEAITWKEYRP
jgi:predicted nucleic acid-binding protein